MAVIFFRRHLRFLLLGLLALPLGPTGLHAGEYIKPRPAPAWTLKDVNSKPVSFDHFRGKVVVLDFWATWCAPCRAEIPGYERLQKKFGKDGLAIIGVSLDQSGPEVVKRFIADHNVNYQIVMGDQKILDAYGGVEAIPTTFIIDRSGMIRYRKVGEMPTRAFEAILRRYLK